MPKNSKYAPFTRSQIMIAINKIEIRLESTKYGTAADQRLREERSQLFEALKEKDAALLERWNRNAHD
jgi:hypothetical protein